MMESWRPREGTSVALGDLVPGQLVAMHFHAWRVTSVEPVPMADLNQAEAASGRSIVQVRVEPVTPGEGRCPGKLRNDPVKRVRVLPEHYAVCGVCHEIPPCRHEMQGIVEAQMLNRMSRFEVPGTCPSCMEAVRWRQRSLTFDENTVVPGGPPVTFHRAKNCFRDAVRYEAILARSLGNVPQLSCAGSLVRHTKVGIVCSLETCPGAGVVHESSVRRCECSGGEVCSPG